MVVFQVVIVGNGAVGKSSMIQRYCKGTFTKDYKKTIGVDFLERQIESVIIIINIIVILLNQSALSLQYKNLFVKDTF